ncbi:glutamate--tRNA ligase [Actinomycetaceae bacterium WB03_NA08]|uniref:Glutamate--tRNA ligase n=1 Tax=Scrofimicrobium canadense TaxID=2652290 RepID=A0A6N7W5K0_9ACTO|nr:glutamate--tRNA ligase [Scrofimicrobium canadense]MSS83722.1 glutamate--tRNA ligase [Scrofimicrobium canadense]
MALNESVRVRFCPSPTGTPHVGMVRTCLFNWAYARHTGGTFVFRIEDTDAQRDSQESFDQIIESLQWLGLDWDEGIGVGGPHGPYRQSERMDIYKDVIPKLLEGGYAYESYSTPEEVEARHIAAGRSPKLGYDGFDRNLTQDQIDAFRAEGREPVIRMRMPDEDVSFTDLIRGEVTFKAGSIPDYVIVRANGDPLYTLVNPVDDAMMKITHVLRGEDLLSSTPRQVVLYRALVELGIADAIPQFGHLPYVMGEGNKKLSKRDPESNLLLHRKNGMIPEGLLNYLALLGWSISPDEDIFTMEEMVKAFDISDVNPNPARFDQKKCTAINADHIRMLTGEDFRGRIVPFLHEADLVSAPDFDSLLPREKEILTAAAPLIQTRIQTLAESVGMLGFFFILDDQVTIEPDAKKTLKAGADEVLAKAIEVLQPLEDFSAENLNEVFREAIVEKMGVKPRLAFGPLRVALSGKRVSPPLFESMEILGKAATLTRLRQLSDQVGTAQI